MPAEIYDPQGILINLDEELVLAKMLHEESRLARAFLKLHRLYVKEQAVSKRQEIDKDFLGWIKWDSETVPRNVPLIIRFDNGAISAPRSFENTLNWGERANEIVAYRLAKSWIDE